MHASVRAQAFEELCRQKLLTEGKCSKTSRGKSHAEESEACDVSSKTAASNDAHQQLRHINSADPYMQTKIIII